ncbi:peptide ABC transporter substrate-binding protein [Brachybacterium sp. AOP24-D1-21]|uniref:peptide ABC transporter substrate-binding protein n=1 Tax=Brachybacterium sp. AOP24-D1-21 TaxID=3457711 RepID=UPI004034BC4D
MAKTQDFGTVSRRVLLGMGVGGAGLLASGCSLFDSSSGGSGGGSGEDGAKSITIASTGTIDALDPHYVNNSMTIVPSALGEGLVMQSEDGSDVVPALAESWDESEDGLTYTFHLREAKWSNGEPITSDDVAFSFQRLLTPSGAGTGYAAGASSFLPSIGIKGAADFQSGASSDWAEVGITAPDEKTVEVTLEAANPDFLINMSHYSMTVLNKASVEADPEGWTAVDSWVSNGPFRMTQWDPTTVLEMEKNPEYWDADNVDIDHVTLQLGGDLPTNVLAFSAGEMDVIGVDGVTLNGDPSLEEKLTKVDGYACHYLQTMWGGHDAIRDQKVRQALSMAIDRGALTENDPGKEAAGTLVPSSVPEWSEDLMIPFDPDGAKALLEEAGYGDGLPPMRVQMGFESPMFAILAEQLKDTLGLAVSLEVLEGGVHADTRWLPYEDTSVMSFYYGSFAGISTMPNWILNIFGIDHVRQFSMPVAAWDKIKATRSDESLDGAQIAAQVEEILSTKSTPEAQKYAELARAAAAELDEAKRTQTFLEAAALRDEMAFTIPLVWGAQMWVTSDRLSGLQGRPSPEGYYYKHLTASE